MKVPAAVGEAVTHLPWLSPCAASLVAMARLPGLAAWSVIRSDPGAVLHLLRNSAPPEQPATAFFPSLLNEPVVLETASRQIEQNDSAVVDWSDPGLDGVYKASTIYARVAQRIAEITGKCNAENAWVAGLLAPLGWFAVAAIEPELVVRCLRDPAMHRSSSVVQQQLWNLDHSAIARRLGLRWRLPSWLTAVAGHLGLPPEIAKSLGADVDLFRIVQLAVTIVQRHERGLNLAVGAGLLDNASALELSAEQVEDLEKGASELRSQSPPEQKWASPASVPLLRDTLLVAAENKRLKDAPALERLERDVDDLHQSLVQQVASETERLQARKLNALAEFAAGAGHEINNPLAVISGQAQYLLNHETEPDRQKSLQTIIGQTHRIHQILNELMQFARPPRPQKQSVDLAALLREVITSSRELAEQKGVQLNCPELETVFIDADPRQVRQALTCLLRNAIEAATADGWAGVRLEKTATDQVDVLIEDNGNGPPASLRENLFDPFYSGRAAGRGRGMGLPTAWRLAREQGGDVRFADIPGGPTRFILSLPHEPSHNGHHSPTRAELRA